MPAEVGGQVRRRLGHPRANDEPHARLIKGLKTTGWEHAGVGDHDQVLNPGPLPEVLDHGDYRAGFGLVALPAAYL